MNCTLRGCASALARATRRIPLLALADALLLPVWAHVLGGLGGDATDDLFGKWISDAVFVLAAVACLTHAVRHRERRLAAAVLGIGLLLFATGNLIYSMAPDLAAVPVPSISDPLWLAIYPCVYVALIALTRERVDRTLLATRLDGIVSGLTIAAVVACVSVPAAVQATAGAPLAEHLTSLAYPVADLALLGAVVSAVALGGWRLDRLWGILAFGVLAWEAADLIFAIDAEGTYANAADALVMTGVVVMATAVCGRPAVATAPSTTSNRGLFVPIGFGALALALLIVAAPLGLHGAVIGLAGAALALVLVRMTLALRENRGLLAASEIEATTDALTGLGNRRKFKDDLARVLGAEEVTPHLVVMLDLNGFKTYNDSYGHAAGDALLAQIGGALAEAVSNYGEAYRMGGDEFCVLAAETAAPDAFGAACAEALATRGDGFAITAAHGIVSIPEECPDVSGALALADARMYRDKRSGRRPTAQQTADALLAMIEERAPELARHMLSVQSLACSIASDLGLQDSEYQALAHAALLHDIGKLAIPDSILEKPGPLSDAEWELIRRHTLIGERILAAAPALERSARLVRWSHERLDGNGYPDGLRGGDIPLAARIVFVADAFDAMTEPRAYHEPRGIDGALAELHACAPAQFDPDVVAALTRVLARAEAA